MTMAVSNAGRLLAPLLLLTGAPAGAAELVLAPGSGHIVEAVINGTPLRLKVVLDHGEGITLNPWAAARAGLGQGEGRWTQTIGPVKVRGRFSELPVTIAGQTREEKVNWFPTESIEGADGFLSAYLLPYESVTLQTRAPSAPEREVALATKFHHNHGIHAPLAIGGERIAVRFSLDRPRTTAPAAAAAIIAQGHGGVLEETPGSEEIARGVSRPVRPLRLDRPLRIGGFSIPVLMARTSDWRGKHQLPPTAASKNLEIVVTGARASQEALYRVTVGLDVLKRCSAATYSRRTALLTFRCATG